MRVRRSGGRTLPPRPTALLQSRINAAAVAGGTVRLPPGDLYLESALVVPPGAINLTIEGTSTTRLRRHRNFVGSGSLLSIGTETGTGTTYRSTGSVAQGSQSITTTSGGLTPGVWYYWQSDRRVRHGGDTGSTSLQFADQGLFSPGSASGDLSKNSSTAVDIRELNVVKNLTLRNFTVDAAVGSSIGNQGIYMTGVVGFVIEDVSVLNFYTQGTYARRVRNGTVTRYYSETTPGESLRYGFEVNGSSDVDFVEPSGMGGRKVVLFSQGSARCTVTDGLAVGPMDNPFDCHGSGSHDILFLRCFGNGSMLCGNPSWRIGDTDIEFRDCVGTSFVVGPNSKAKIVRGYADRLIIMSAGTDSVNDSTQCPRTGPLLVEVEDSSFINPSGIALETQDWWDEFSGVRRFGDVIVTGTRFEGTWAVGSLGGVASRLLTAMPNSTPTSLQFYDCQFHGGVGIDIVGTLTMEIAVEGGQAWEVSGNLLSLSAGITAGVYTGAVPIVLPGGSTLIGGGSTSTVISDPRSP